MEPSGATQAGIGKEPHFPRIESVCLMGGFLSKQNQCSFLFRRKCASVLQSQFVSDPLWYVLNQDYLKI